jgi:protein involved in polysaccharide export with SLBB domain
MIKRLLRWGAILVIGLQLGGCLTDYGPVVSDAAPAAPTAVASKIRPGDQLKIIVYGEDALSGLYEVSPAGSISLPLVGSVMAAGRTKSDIEHILTREYSDRKFLQDPKITVSDVSFGPFFVLGEVTTPGQYPYKSGIDVLSAVATAGGFTYRASRTSVLIRHGGDNVWQEYSLATPVPIAPGDLIRVPERYF